MGIGYLKILVLNELKNSSLTGSELIKNVEGQFGKKPSPGSIYPLLKDLTNEKYITYETYKNTKIYSITKKGKTFVDKLLEEKETTLIQLAEVLGLLKTLSNKDYSKIISLINDKGQSDVLALRNADLWIEITSLVLLSSYNDDLANGTKKILEKAIKDIRKNLNGDN